MNENQIEFINIIKLLIYKENSKLLEKIDFENDDAFMEPLLFAYFNSKKDKLYDELMLNEIMQGYFIKKESIKLSSFYNKNDSTFIPNLGYFYKDNVRKYEPILKIGDFEILKEIHPVLERYFRETSREHITNSNPGYKSAWKESIIDLEIAIDIIKNHIPTFYKELIFANRRIFLHNNSKILNFTSFETLGMLFFYVLKNNNVIYFIEELIHQGSHNLLYYIVHNRKDFFKVDVDTIVMKHLTKQNWDYRTVYGAFHGLFTVSQRLKYFDQLLMENVLFGKQKHELLGRLADQFSRFRTGLELLNFNDVYTDRGFLYYNELDFNCQNVLNKYKKLESFFDLSNRDLDFRYDDFCKLNSFAEFNKKDDEGFFNF